MTNLFFIAHKVRGEPAFDVAEQMQVGEETWWIIPTSGHRAYPFWTRSLLDVQEGGFDANEILMPEGLRDHYEISSDKPPTTRRAPRPVATLEELA